MHRAVAHIAAAAFLACSFAIAQNQAVIPPVAATLPGNAAISMPLRWTHGVMQCCVSAQLLPANLAGGQLQGIRMRRPSFLDEPAYPSLQRSLTVRAAFTAAVPSSLTGTRATNAPTNLLTVFGPAPVQVAATSLPTGTPWTGDEFLVIPFTPALPVTAGSLFLEFETSDLPPKRRCVQEPSARRCSVAPWKPERSVRSTVLPGRPATGTVPSCSGPAVSTPIRSC